MTWYVLSVEPDIVLKLVVILFLKNYAVWTKSLFVTIFVQTLYQARPYKKGIAIMRQAVQLY